MLGLKEVNWGDKYLATGDLMGKDDDGSEKKYITKTKQTNLSGGFCNPA